MESSVDNSTNQKRKSGEMVSSSIATRTRSMQKRLSSSQETVSEKSPKKELKSKCRMNNSDELSSSPVKYEDLAIPSCSGRIESRKSKNNKNSKVKDIAPRTTRKSYQHDNTEEEHTAKSDTSKQKGTNITSTRNSKSKNVKHPKNEGNSPTKKTKSSELECDHLETDEKTSSVEDTNKREKKLDVNKELPKIEIPSESCGPKLRRKSKLLTDHTIDVLEEQEEGKSCGTRKSIGKSPVKDSKIKDSKTMSESSSEKSKRSTRKRNSAEKSLSKSASIRLMDSSVSEGDHSLKDTEEKPSQKLPSPQKSKVTDSAKMNLDSSFDMPQKTSKKLNKREGNDSTAKSDVSDSEVSSDQQNVPSSSQVSGINNSPTRTMLLDMKMDSSSVQISVENVQEDHSKSLDNETDTTEHEDISAELKGKDPLRNTEKLQDSGDGCGIHNSGSDFKTLSEQKKIHKDSSSGTPEKVKQTVECGSKIVTKATKDSNTELSKSLISNQAQMSEKSAPSVISPKVKGFVVENFSSSNKKPSPKNQPSKQASVTCPDSDSDAESRKAIMESAQRRIEQNLSTSESDSRYLAKTPHKSVVRKPTVDAGSSDSGSAPENVSFESGRKTAMESLKNAVESIQREKQRRKAKRKERLEKLKQQKEEKLIRLKEKLASQEDASCSSSEESGYEEVAFEAKRGKKKRAPKTRALRTEKENVDGSSVMVLKKTAFSDMDSDDSSTKAAGQVAVSGGLKRLPSDVLDNLPDQIPLKFPKISQEDSNKKKRKKDKADLKDSLEKDFKKPANLDYIPLETEGPTKFGVVPLEKAIKAPKSVSQQAADFRQNMLYGSHIAREPAKTVTIYQQKIKASGNDRHVR